MNHAKPTSFHRSQFIPSIYLFTVTCNLDFNDDNVKFDSIESSILLAYNNDNDNNTATIVERLWTSFQRVNDVRRIFYIGQNLDS